MFVVLPVREDLLLMTDILENLEQKLIGEWIGVLKMVS